MGQLFVTSLTDYYAFCDPARDPSQLATSVTAWREDLQRTLGEQVSLKWSETRAKAQVYEFSAAAHRSVSLLACYAEQPQLEWPDDLPATLAEDPAWQRSSAQDYARTRWAQVLIPSVWLPGSFHLTLNAGLPDGEEAVFGSVDGLLEQLHRLNAATMNLDAGALEFAAQSESIHEGFLLQAQAALARWIGATAHASASHLPLLLRGC